MNADGSNDHAVTSNGAANFAPFFLPGGREIIFSSNLSDPKGREFELYLIREDGTGLTRVTFIRGLRRVPDVHARRQAPGLRVQPQRREAAGDEHLRRRLGSEVSLREGWEPAPDASTARVSSANWIRASASARTTGPRKRPTTPKAADPADDAEEDRSVPISARPETAAA